MIDASNLKGKERKKYAMEKVVRLGGNVSFNPNVQSHEPFLATQETKGTHIYAGGDATQGQGTREQGKGHGKGPMITMIIILFS